MNSDLTILPHTEQGEEFDFGLGERRRRRRRKDFCIVAGERVEFGTGCSACNFETRRKEWLRIGLRLPPTRLHHVPGWMRPRLLRAFHVSGEPSSGFSVLLKAVKQCGGGGFLDHWGSSRRGKNLVCEPYSLTDHDREVLNRLCAALNCKWRLRSFSWWMPPRGTVRVEIFAQGVPL